MALIQCPECKKEISDSVKKCPHCGYRIRKSTAGKKALAIAAVCVLAAAALVFFFVIQPNQVLDQAEKYISDGKYTEAENVLLSARDGARKSELLKKIDENNKLNQAAELLLEGDAEEAGHILNYLPDSERKTQLSQKVSELEKLKQAEWYIENNQISEAAALLDSLPDSMQKTSLAAAIKEEEILAQAEALIDRGKYDEADVILATAKSGERKRGLIARIILHEVEEALDAGNTDLAEKKLSQLDNDSVPAETLGRINEMKAHNLLSQGKYAEAEKYFVSLEQTDEIKKLRRKLFYESRVLKCALMVKDTLIFPESMELCEALVFRGSFSRNESKSSDTEYVYEWNQPVVLLHYRAKTRGGSVSDGFVRFDWENGTYTMGRSVDSLTQDEKKPSYYEYYSSEEKKEYLLDQLEISLINLELKISIVDMTLDDDQLVRVNRAIQGIKGNDADLIEDNDIVSFPTPYTVQITPTPAPTPIPTPSPEPVIPVNEGSDSNNHELFSNYGYITADGVNFREEPYPSSRRIKLLKKYAYCYVYGTVVSDGDTWYKVSYNETDGYISSRYFRLLTVSEADEFVNSSKYTEGLKNNSEINTENVIPGKNDDGPERYYEVTSEPAEIPTDIPTEIPTEIPQKEPTATPTLEPIPENLTTELINRYGKTNSKVFLRTDASTSSKNQGILKKNCSVYMIYTMINDLGETWTYVMVDGKTGYVMTSYLDMLTAEENAALEAQNSPVPVFTLEDILPHG